ncbi:CLUMA_CG021088, isoform A [Clunio marinus]|uniref:CLUMA_CG021088, isoform A n=1 Tax=Clunio marinus TaxID=568069 RepID=A0A1J1J667_9DIPT|nr:CLUMA_CG021088, isoform A [Clunio marinus]
MDAMSLSQILTIASGRIQYNIVENYFTDFVMNELVKFRTLWKLRIKFNAHVLYTNIAHGLDVKDVLVLITFQSFLHTSRHD